jgi:Na+-transporting NADH:ubiquinone oxidoreductase subunit NqrC
MRQKRAWLMMTVGQALGALGLLLWAIDGLIEGATLTSIGLHGSLALLFAVNAFTWYQKRKDWKAEE